VVVACFFGGGGEGKEKGLNKYRIVCHDGNLRHTAMPTDGNTAITRARHRGRGTDLPEKVEYGIITSSVITVMVGPLNAMTAVGM
jgi:hypothetical protein